MEKNKIYHLNFLENNLPDKCANLIIADPPYFEVKGEFDFIWSSFEEYLNDVEKWAIECKRILKDNGSLFWYGDSKKIAYSQVILDKHFNLLNSLVWNKGSFMGLEKSSDLKSFAPCTERILFYGSSSFLTTGLKEIEKEFIAPRNPFSKQLKEAREKKGVSINEVAEYGKFYGKVNHGGSVTNWERGYNIPNFDQWQILCENLPIEITDFEILKREYDNLRIEFEHLKRFFNNEFELTEVLNFSNEAQKTGKKYDHETVKPETLTEALILTTSRISDLVLVPFAGSGTECAMSLKNGRDFIGFDIDEKHVQTSSKRTGVILANPTLF